MIQVSYEMAGAILAIVLTVGLIVSRIIKRKRNRSSEWQGDACIGASGLHEIEHRAILFLMAQKTDAVLAALAKTIAQEREKLGAVVRNPSMDDAMVAFQAKRMKMPNSVVSASGENARPEIQTAQKAGSAGRRLAAPDPSRRARPSISAPPHEVLSSTMHPSAASPYDHVLQLVDAGMDVPAIARRLKLPEAEVSMVIRLRAA